MKDDNLKFGNNGGEEEKDLDLEDYLDMEELLERCEDL